MPYINNDGDSRLNNFPTEPQMYTADPTTPSQKRNSIIIAIVGIVLVGGLMFIAMAVS